MYKKTILNVSPEQKRPSEFDADQETARATWDAANQDLYSALFFTIAGSAFSVVRKFQGKTPAGGAGHGQQSSSREIDGCSRAAIRADHIRMPSTRMRPGQDPDDYMYHMDSCGDRLNACNSPDGPKDRQYEDTITQVLPSEYDRIRQTHLERRDFGLADIRRMMAAIYADNLSCSESSKGIAGRGAGMQAVDRDPVPLLRPIGVFQKKVPTPNQTLAVEGAAVSSTSSATTTWSISAKAARATAKQRWRRRRSCVVFISQDNVP